MVRFVGVICWVLLALFIASLVATAMEGGVVDGFKGMMGAWWGRATLADLYIGFAFAAAWMSILERERNRWWLWPLAQMILGNLVLLVYIGHRSMRCSSVSELFLGPQSAGRS